MMTFRRWIAVLAALLFAPRAHAQQRIPNYGEYRADVITGASTALQGGGAVVFPMGVYTRLSLGAAGGVAWRDSSTRMSGRVDLLARFLLDPFREVPIGVSLGGGVTVPYTDGDRLVRPYIAAVIDVEGRMRGRVTPALQVGLGGGTRVGLVLRVSPRSWR